MRTVGGTLRPQEGVPIFLSSGRRNSEKVKGRTHQRVRGYVVELLAREAQKV